MTLGIFFAIAGSVFSGIHYRKTGDDSSRIFAILFGFVSLLGLFVISRLIGMS